MDKFSIRLRTLRQSLSQTQDYVSKQIGMSRRRYYDLENEKNNPSYEILLSICNYFDVSADYMMCRNNNPKSHKSQ